MTTVVEDSFLVTRAQRGDADAFEELVRRHVTVAYRVALRLLGNHHDAQDATQDAMLSAWRSISAFRNESAFSTWLYQIVTRAALNKLTRGHRGDIVTIPDTLHSPGDGPADAAEREHSAAAVAAAVAALPPSQRIAVVLHHFENLSYAEVAEITESSVPAVRSHLFRARRALAATLGQWK